MAVLHPPMVQPIQPYHSHCVSGSVINDCLDVDTAALIATVALDGLADVLGADSLARDARQFHPRQW
jgi:hypothetical protein